MTNKEIQADLFPDLTNDEVRQLCYIAYFGEDYGSAIPQYIQHYHKSRKSYDATVLKLTRLGYLQNHNSTMPERHLDIIDFLATIRQEWLDDFKRIRQYSPRHTYEYLWKLASMLRNDDFEGAANLTKPYEGLGRQLFNVYSYISKRMVRDSRYATLLDDEQLYMMIAETLEDMLQRGVLDEQSLDTIRKMITGSNPRYKEMMERVDMYEYFITGILTFYEHPDTLWSLSMMAIKELYCENVEDSLALFRKAVRKQGAKARALPIPMLNWFFAMCVIKYRTKYGPMAMTDVMQNLRDSPNLKLGNGNFAARLLLNYAEVANEKSKADIEERVKVALGDGDNKLNQCFAVLLSHFFAIPIDRNSAIAPLQPVTAILTHELSPFIALSTKTKEYYESLFSGKPILANIRRKTSWEILLGEIDTAMEKTFDERPRRIIYFMKGLSLSSIVEQVQNEDGIWDDARLLSRNVLCKEGYESMDLHDSRIAMGLTNKEDWQTDADVIVPNLAGTERLFQGVEFLPTRSAAEIRQQKPYIDFSGKGDKIIISSNIKMTPSGYPRKHTVTNEGNAYSLVTLNALQKDILMKLLTHRSLPASAAPTLRKTIDSISGILEVRENILSDIEMNAFESDGRIVARLQPIREDLCQEYQMTMLAMPLAKGISRLIPNSGEEYVYDEDEAGQTHCVHRNMQREYENYQMMVDYAEQFDMEFKDYNVCIIGDERVLLNFLSFCHSNQDRFSVEWPNGQTLKFKGILTENNVDIEVKSDIDWFAVEGKVKIGNEYLSLEELLKAYCNSSYDGFVSIGENEYIQLTETLRRHVAELDGILSMGKQKHKSAPKYLVGALADTLQQMNQKVDDGYKEFRDKMKKAYETAVIIPEGLKATLRPYQLEGYQWLMHLDAWGAGACLADDMGLGKTLQAITFMLSKAEKGASLVIAPKSVIPNWTNEVQKFAPQMNVIILNDATDREQVVDAAEPYTLILCTYGVLTTEAELLASKPWNVVCLDEAHQIKNRNTQVSKAAMNLKAQSRVILTGTPLQNHVGELWNLMQFLNPGILGRWNVFRDTYVNGNQDEQHRDMLKEMVQPFILRRTKQQVLHDLPEKIEGTHYVTMTDEEMEVYEAMRQRVELKFKKNKDKEERMIASGIDVSYFEELMKLRLASCDMHLVHDKWKFPSSKIESLMEILATLMIVPDNNILVFSQFTSFLGRIKPELEKRGWDYYYLDGQTPMKKRQTMVEEFQHGQKRLFLSSLKAGGLGINLTQANYVILLDPWWNPAIENQATDRAHRIGQQRCVSVIRLISQQTIEEKILKLHEMKQSVSDDILDGTSESYKLTYDDILEMVAPY